MIAPRLKRITEAIYSEQWTEDPQFEPLNDGELHVWLVKIEPALAERTRSFLSAKELERAARFRFPEHRNEFIVSRGMLRTLLGRYTNISPSRLAFEYEHAGKPRVTNGPDNLFFNVSHSDGLALIAFSAAGDVGVDIERIDGSKVEPGMLSHCFHPAEMRRFLSFPVSEQRENYFFEVWTAKEAYLKLLGDGLAITPSAVESVALRLRNESGDTEPVYFSDVPTIKGYSASIATRKPAVQTRFYAPAASLFP